MSNAWQEWVRRSQTNGRIFVSFSTFHFQRGPIPEKNLHSTHPRRKYPNLHSHPVACNQSAISPPPPSQTNERIFSISSANGTLGTLFLQTFQNQWGRSMHILVYRVGQSLHFWPFYDGRILVETKTGHPAQKTSFVFIYGGVALPSYAIFTGSGDGRGISVCTVADKVSAFLAIL